MAPPGPALAGRMGEDPWRRGYLNRVGLFAELLASSFAREAFDCVVSPPSRFDHARPYREAILRRMPGAVDLTGDFTRREGTYAGCGHSLPALRRALAFRPRLPLRSQTSVLIVDDILWQGKTAAAVLHHLRRAGLPDSARIALACPLWID
jgi:predicted amidophosphoribosyltransferase